MDESISIPGTGQPNFIGLASDIVAAFVSNNSVPVGELPALLSRVHTALAGLGSGSAPVGSAVPALEKLTPAKIRKSITPDALISFIDGKPYKTLKRHLTGNGLTMEQYRELYGLPRDYPSTAASYSAMRAEFARSNGLGQHRQKAAAKAANTAETVAEAPKARGRKKAAAPAVQTAEKPARAGKPSKAAAAI